MALGPTLPPQARRILDLARSDRRVAGAELGALPLEQQVALVCETPTARRAELLELLADPAPVVRALPEAELCFTVKSLGLADAGWILDFAEDDQLRACFDLDAWRDLAPDPSALDAWFAALEAASEESIVRAAKCLDVELLVLWLRAHVTVVLKENDAGWEPPLGAATLDGQFHLLPRRSGEDLERVLPLLDRLFRGDYWFYFRLLQGVISELPSDLEEWALRWRTARLQDLGFPSWDEAMRIYAIVPAAGRAKLPDGETPLSLGEWRLPVWLPRLPARGGPEHLVFRAAAELGPEERSSFFFAFVALANRVAVADRMPLGDAESLPAAIERAALLTGRGLEFLSDENGLRPVEVLRRVSLGHLLRVGFSLDRESRAP